MAAGFAADLVLAVHFLFILFVVGGGLLAFRWLWLPWLHLPAAFWGVIVEWSGGICPLTPLENRLRLAAGREAYGESFVEYYLMPVIYPDGLTREIQILLGLAVIVVNAVVYACLIAAVRRRRSPPDLQGGG